MTDIELFNLIIRIGCIITTIVTIIVLGILWKFTPQILALCGRFGEIKRN